MKTPLAVILAGGRGNRMDILCHDRAKPILPFGRNRVIDYTLSNCLNSGVRDIALLVDYQRSGVAKYGHTWAAANAPGRAILSLEPKAGSYKGTADAVYQNAALLKAHEAGEVLVLAADHVYKMDYRGMLEYHRSVQADVTVAVVRVPADQAHRFGIVQTDGQGKIVTFKEKPLIPEGDLASMGIYIFNKDVLLARLAADAADESSIHDFGHVVVPAMVRRDRVFAYEFNDYWRDIGDVQAYYRANIELINQPSPFSMNGEWPVFTRDVLGERQPVITGKVKGSTVSPGCIVRGIVENSVLSSGVRVEENARVSNSIVMANTVVGQYSVVDRSILDEDVRIGSYCYVGFGSGLPSGQADVTVVGKGVTVPSRTAIGCRCKILPNVGAADFVTRTVRSGDVVVGHSMP